MQTPFAATFFFLPYLPVSLCYIDGPLGNFLAMYWKEARVRPDIWHGSLHWQDKLMEPRFRRPGPAHPSFYDLLSVSTNSVPQPNRFLLEKLSFLPSLPICPLCSIKGAEWEAISIKIYSCLLFKVLGFSLFCLYPSQTSPSSSVCLLW